MSRYAFSDLDLGWIVGFLEGEGHFLCRRSGPDKTTNSIAVGASQKTLEPLEKLVRLCGGKIYRRPEACAQWHLAIQRDAEELARIILPHMSERRQEQINKMLRHRATARTHGWRNVAKTHCPKGHPYSGANLYIKIVNGKHGGTSKPYPARGCRACHNEQQKVRYRVKHPAA